MRRAPLVGRLRAEGHTITITGNLAARLGAVGALSAASLLVARTGGPAAVGTLALLRVLPWFVGLLLSGGLYGAAPYFLSGPGRAEPRYRTTLPAMAVVAGAVGAGIWVAAAPLFGPRLLPELSRPLVVAAGAAVLTQCLETTAKTCSQGFDDLAGSNRIIVLEEALFVPIYGLAAAAGASSYFAMIVALPLGDVLTGSSGWARLWRRGYFHGAGRPSPRLARAIAGYGTRAELNSITQLLNGRLDFVIVNILVGPAALGIYAVASRAAELLRLPSLAINYVLYPAYARLGRDRAAAQARRAARRTWWVPAALAAPVAIGAPVMLPLVYGNAFSAAVAPTWILLAGLAGGSVNAVMTAYFSGTGRPGLTSLAQAAGLAVTVALDLALIPRIGIIGAATASAFAYLTTTAVLVACFGATDRALRPGAQQLPETEQFVVPEPIKVAAPAIPNVFAPAYALGEPSYGSYPTYPTYPTDPGGTVMKILTIAAHPDDETLGAGGTMARLAAGAHEVRVCILTDGVTARHGHVERQKECAIKACDALGVSDVVFCGLPDQRLDSLPLLEVIIPIEKYIEEFRPDLVFTHYKEDANQDHRVAFAATLVATRPSPGSSVSTVLCYETASSTEWAPPFTGSVFSPNLYVDISRTLELKLAALREYEQTFSGEMRPFPHPRSYQALAAQSQQNGARAGVMAAEAFMLVRHVYRGGLNGHVLPA